MFKQVLLLLMFLTATVCPLAWQKAPAPLSVPTCTKVNGQSFRPGEPGWDRMFSPHRAAEREYYSLDLASGSVRRMK